MSSTVISDTSCLIFISKINLLDFVSSSYQTVYITPVVAKEYGLSLPHWIITREPKDQLKVKELLSEMDLGEATAITLALEIKDCDLLLDDLAARNYALQHQLKFTGTLGILLKAKGKGVIEKVRPLLEELKNQGLRISAGVENEVLRLAGEL